MHRLSHMDERTLATRVAHANPTLFLTLTAFPRSTGKDRHRFCSTSPPKHAVRLSRRGTTATPPDRPGTGSGEMKHQSTRALYDYWTTKRGRRRAPARSDIDPADIRRILANTFILTADFVNDVRVRLAGTRVCALFAREIKGDAFEDLWSEPGREQMHGLLTAVIDENAGAVAGVLARTEQGARKSNWSYSCCLSPLIVGLAFGRLAYWRQSGAGTGKRFCDDHCRHPAQAGQARGTADLAGKPAIS